MTNTWLSGRFRKYDDIRGTPGGAWLCPRTLVYVQYTSSPASAPGIHQWHLSVSPYLRNRPLSRRPRSCIEAVLECALDARVKRVQPVERERLDGGEAAAGGAGGTVMAEHAVQQVQSAGVVEHAGALGDHALAD